MTDETKTSAASRLLTSWMKEPNDANLHVLLTEIVWRLDFDFVHPSTPTPELTPPPRYDEVYYEAMKVADAHPTPGREEEESNWAFSPEVISAIKDAFKQNSSPSHPQQVEQGECKHPPHSRRSWAVKGSGTFTQWCGNCGAILINGTSWIKPDILLESSNAG